MRVSSQTLTLICTWARQPGDIIDKINKTWRSKFNDFQQRVARKVLLHDDLKNFYDRKKKWTWKIKVILKRKVLKKKPNGKRFLKSRRNVRENWISADVICATARNSMKDIYMYLSKVSPSRTYSEPSHDVIILYFPYAYIHRQMAFCSLISHLHMFVHIHSHMTRSDILCKVEQNWLRLSVTNG